MQRRKIAASKNKPEENVSDIVLASIRSGFSKAMDSSASGGLLPDSVSLFGRAATKLPDNNQGEHVTSYGLYERRVSALMEKHIGLAAKDFFTRGITAFINEIRMEPRIDEHLLSTFDLAFKSQDPFNKLILKIERLRSSCNQKIDAIYRQTVIIRNLQKKPPVDRSESDATEITQLRPDILEEPTDSTRQIYFFEVVKEFAQEYLIYKNKSKYVAFIEIPGKTQAEKLCDRGEGGRVQGVLSRLDYYKVVAATSDDVQRIIDDISMLLYFPPLNYENIKKLKELSESSYSQSGINENIRTNNIKIFKYIVARHLLTIFAAFRGLGMNLQVKETIADGFVLRMLEKPFYKGSDTTWAAIFRGQKNTEEIGEIRLNILQAFHNVEQVIKKEQEVAEQTVPETKMWSLQKKPSQLTMTPNKELQQRVSKGLLFTTPPPPKSPIIVATSPHQLPRVPAMEEEEFEVINKGSRPSSRMGGGNQ